MNARSIIELHGLGRQFGPVTALADVNLTVSAGEWLTLMGPSGSGKTTLLNLLALLDTPTDGAYLLEGEPTAGLDAEARATRRRERIGLVFQQFHLVPHLSALDNVMLAQFFHSMPDRREAEAALDRVGLHDRMRHRPAQLSGGEKQRVCIARALVNDPALLLADEPTGNLDAENEARVIALFRALHAEGRSLVLITHNPALQAFGDRTAHLDHGRLIETPRPTEAIVA